MIRLIVQEFREKELLVQASAIAFRIVTAAIPAMLFAVAVLGALQLDELWRQDAAPELRDNVSGPVYQVINDAVTRVLERQNHFWITIGAVLAIGAMASVVDAVTRTLNRIHGAEETRSFRERIGNAAAIGALTGVLLLAAIGVVRLGPFLFGDGLLIEVVSFVVRWGLAAALLMAVVVLMVRVAPDMERPLRRVGRGAAITVGGWILLSLLFSLYLRYLGQYDSIFGHLATLYIAVQYVALSSVVYVSGLVIDAVAVRKEPR